MTRYTFTDGPVFVNRKTADPQKIGEALEKARKETPDGGDMRLTALEHARKRGHALHRHLEWDDAVAGHKWRLHQISLLICAIRVEDEESGEQKPAFISVTPSDGRRHFATPTEIVGSLEMQLAMLKAAERDLQQWQQRYRTLSDLCEGIEATRRKIAERRAAYEERASAA